MYGAYGLTADAAGENISGTNVDVEPYGAELHPRAHASGDQLYPGPGNNAFIDRPPVCTQQAPTRPRNCVPGIVRGGSGSTPGARTDTVTGSGAASTITDGSIIGDDTGRAITSITVGGTAVVSGYLDVHGRLPQRDLRRGGDRQRSPLPHG